MILHLTRRYSRSPVWVNSLHVIRFAGDGVGGTELQMIGDYTLDVLDTPESILASLPEGSF